MKRIFPLIIVLISLSLIGIIVIQLSWLKNMVLLSEERVKQKVIDATTIVGAELAQHKGNYSSSSTNRIFPSDNFSLELIRPVTVGQRFTADEIREKIKAAFMAVQLDEAPFEFGLATISPRGMIDYFERQSPEFASAYSDSSHNYSYIYPLISPSGSAAENLTPDEILIVIVPDWKNLVFKSLRLPISSAIIFTIIIIAAFYLTISTMIRQKKLSEIKNDFINNMTHEFKTPLATISLAVDALRNDKVRFNGEKMSYFSNIIKEENQRMNRQVETILRAALMDRQEVKLNLTPVHAHIVIKNVLDNFTLQLQDRKGDVELSLNAENDLVNADEVHFPNLINNLIDNSIKYAKENVPPKIKIATQNTGKELLIRLEDNGIGMNKETVKRIFEKFYRAHTGNLHNVKGFGLGLSYVKTMVEAHHGEIKADSTLGKGSCFIIKLPLKKVTASA
ncbi:MAG TPA: HAMP domain-containing sensor histidine kinase [Chitinophagaceae bacterium]